MRNHCESWPRATSHKDKLLLVYFVNAKLRVSCWVVAREEVVSHRGEARTVASVRKANRE